MPPARIRSVLFLVPLLSLIQGPLSAQEGRLTFSASVGPGLLAFDEIDEEGRKDIEAYNRLGVPVTPYDPLRFGLTVEGQIEYRADREFSFGVFGLHMLTRTNTHFEDTSQILSLKRSITSTDIGIDISYYFPPLVYDAEAALFVGIGRMVGRAEQTTFQRHAEKSADTTINIVDQEAFAEYSKAKLYVRAGARLFVSITHSFRVNVSALYKFAPIGELDGTLREFTLVRPHTTTVSFNFSTVDLKVGLSYIIE